MTSDYVALHQHGQTSFLDGEASIESIARGAAERGQTATALTDHQEVAGHLALQKACKKHGIRPIFGMEGYLSDVNAVESKARKYKVPDYSHVTLLAQNDVGLRNLWSWASVASTQNFYYRALMDWETLKPYTEGIYVSDGCMLSWIAKSIIAGDESRTHELMARYLGAFGDNFYMELHTWQFVDPQTEEHCTLNKDMALVNQVKVELAQQYSVPLVVVNDNHYVNREDWVRHNLVWAMNTSDEADKTGSGECAAWLMVDDELVHWMGKHGVSEAVTREAIRNTKMISDNCDIEITAEPKMPRLTGSDLEDLHLFADQVEKGFERKIVQGGRDVELYRERMEEEARMIARKGYAGYFNVVTDFTSHARDDLGIFMGPGRGSAGGSLCAWLLGITRMDPLKYDLLFERFISEDREDYPDIDVDFQKSRIGEIKKYTADKYGADHVCGIGTFTRSQPKAILKDLGRAMGVSFADSNSISKAVGVLPEGMDWTGMLVWRNDTLEPWIRKYPELFKRAEEMVGMVRQSSVHASGWVISPIPLLGNIPLRKKNNAVVTAFEQGEVEEMGFIKMDFLALRHMDTIQFALDLVRERHGIEIDLDEFGDGEFCDPAIWEAVGKGDCLGLFQLDADLMQSTAKRLKPQSEREVAELLAINRPGVIGAGLLTPYIERKHRREEVLFDHPMVEAILNETYGIMIYQEQMMKMARLAAGFSPTRTEYLRKVVGKKLIDKIPALKDEFYAGCKANAAFLEQCNGNPDKTIAKLWMGIEASGSYLFNKSHSVGYALVASWEAWLKTYYYPEFVTACLMTVDDDEMPRYVRHARTHDLRILPPDINVSKRSFTLTNEGVRYGLTSVRNVGAVAYNDILRCRPFSSLEELLDKVTRAKVNKRVVLNLIRLGAFDTMHPEDTRAELEEFYYGAMKTPKAAREKIPDYSDMLAMYRLEKELVGSFILHDPMQQYEHIVERTCLSDPEQIDDMESGALCMIGGMVSKIKKHTTRGGDAMAFISLTFHERDFDAVVFPDAYRAYRSFLKIDAPVVVRAIKTNKGGVQVTALERLDFLTLEDRH